jgi:hypothetical protein
MAVGDIINIFLQSIAGYESLLFSIFAVGVIYKITGDASLTAYACIPVFLLLALVFGDVRLVYVSVMSAMVGFLLKNL